MLSRNAQGLYWMGRYLERAQHGCHLLAEQFIIIEDRPVEQIDQSWRRLYMAVAARRWAAIWNSPMTKTSCWRTPTRWPTI